MLLPAETHLWRWGVESPFFRARKISRSSPDATSFTTLEVHVVTVRCCTSCGGSSSGLVRASVRAQAEPTPSRLPRSPLPRTFSHRRAPGAGHPETPSRVCADRRFLRNRDRHNWWSSTPRTRQRRCAVAVLAFGCAAVLYLVTKELLIEAHETEDTNLHVVLFIFRYTLERIA